MQQRKLGENGPQAVALGLGCMGMSISYGEPEDEESIATIQRAIDLGVNLLVTSDAYGNGANEGLYRQSDHGPARPGPDLHQVRQPRTGKPGRSGRAATLSGGQPDYVVQAREKSLQRLRVDVIDLYGLHRMHKSRCRSRTRWTP